MATYYVSASGSDSNSGLSPQAPWLTVSKVNGFALQPGDLVLFRGGDTFSDTFLAPKSGNTNNPVVYGAYGTGKPRFTAAVFLASKAWVTLDEILVEGPGDHNIQGVQSSGSGSGVTDITIRRCEMRNVSLGVNASKATDARWTIEDSFIHNTNDSGLLLLADTVTVRRCLIADTGLVPPMGTPSHGIYSKGPNQTHEYNRITNFSSSGVSCRYRNAQVIANEISVGRLSDSEAIGWFQYDTVVGTTRWAYNLIHDVKSSLFVSESDIGGTTIENFEVLNNTCIGNDSAGNAFDFRNGNNYTIANNLFTGKFVYALAIPLGFIPAGTLTEKNNLFWDEEGGTQFLYNGSAKASLAAWQAASGQGANDQVADPLLWPDRSLHRGSPAIDAGTPTAGTATYTASGDGAPFHYGGSAPDIGASELGLHPASQRSLPLAIAAPGGAVSLPTA